MGQKKPHRLRRSTPSGEHRPVMLRDVLEHVLPQPGDIAVDCTLGLAGHATAVLELIGPKGKLIGIDWDGDHLPRARERLAAANLPYATHHANFAALPHVLAAEGIGAADIVLADLGMSSMQVDDAGRGFSYVRDGPLDMRMDRSRGRSAADVLATIGETELAALLRDFGDEPNAGQIARAVAMTRERVAIRTTAELARIVAEAVGEPSSREHGWRLHPTRGRWNSHPAARTFQALRLAVNRELANVAELLRVLPTCLRPGGRAAIISFHSGEDRLVKESFRAGQRAGWYRDVGGPLRATEAEKLANPRSRSATLRWAVASSTIGRR
jgi:16S rRNA (cytosine1402-N4)-methyltransferase